MPQQSDLELKYQFETLYTFAGWHSSNRKRISKQNIDYRMIDGYETSRDLGLNGSFNGTLLAPKQL